MGTSIDVANKKALRGEVLTALNQAAAMGMAEKNLILHLDASGFPECRLNPEPVREALFYLSQKGFAASRKVENLALKVSREIWFISAAGIEALEGLRDLDGVGI